MGNHLSDEDIGRYRDRMMPQEESFAANSHLAECEECYGRFDHDYLGEAFRLAQTYLLSEETATEDHISYDERVAFVDGSLSPQDREILESHLEVCPRCETDLEDLRAVKATLRTERELSPGKPRGHSGLIGALRQPAALRPGILMAGSALSAGLAVWIAMLPLRSEVKQSRELIEGQKSAIERMETEVEGLRRQNALLDSELNSTRRDLDMVLASPGKPHLGAETQNSSLNDGDKLVTIDSNGRLSGVGRLSRADELLVKSVLISGRLRTPPTIARLKGRSASMMGVSGASDQYPLLNPVRTVVATNQPTLRWRAVAGASNYVVGVYDSNLNEVVTSPPLSETEWTVSRPLERGKIYAWQVRTTQRGAEIRLPPADMPDAKFKILEQSRAQALERARQSYDGSHLVLGILYAEAGLLDDADRELEALVSANAQSSLARRLLASLKAVYSK